jgi:DNA adenine methylase
VRAPVTIFGGKFYMLGHLLPLVPEHFTYVEPFGGAGWLLFAKEPSPVEVYNDINGHLHNFFRVLREPSLFPRFQRMCEATPYSRQVFSECRAPNPAADSEPVRRAWRFFVVAAQSFSGRHTNSSWSKCTTHSRRGMSMVNSRWLNAVENLPAVHHRLRGVLVESQDFRDCILEADNPGAFFYVDPPYPLEARAGRTNVYEFEMSDDDHRDLVGILLGLKGKALVSGYPSDIYRRLEYNGWKVLEVARSSFAAATGRTRQHARRGAGTVAKSQARTECLWLSPNNEKGLLT